MILVSKRIISISCVYLCKLLLVVAAVFFPFITSARTDGPPLPVHTIEGGGGAAITPHAYLVNPGNNDGWYGKPAVAFTHLDLKDKQLDTLSITNTFFKRLELGYAAANLDLGTLPRDILDATGLNISGELLVHNLSARFLAIQEGQFGDYTPAVTLAAHYKYNDEIDNIDDQLAGTLTSLGYDSPDGVDFTATASKAWPELLFGQTVITTFGLRYSEALWNGYLGYGDDFNLTVDANALILLPHNLFFAYEFRQVPDAIGELGNIIRDETNWHALDLGWTPNDQFSLVFFYGNVGNIVNTNDVDAAWALQVKYEF